MQVVIWDSRVKDNVWGHAALRVDQTYMSWWPEAENRNRSKIHENIYSAGPFRYRTYDDDVRDEEQGPDHVIQLDGLDEARVKDWWQSFGLIRDGVLYQGPLLPWETLKMNCATVAAHGITLAGGRELTPWSGRPWNVLWTPNAVLQYARAVEEGLKRQSGSRLRSKL